MNDISISSNKVMIRKLARNMSIINLQYDDAILSVSNNFIDEGIKAAFEYVASIMEGYHQQKISQIKEALNKLIGLLAYIKIPRVKNIAIQINQQLLNEPLNINSMHFAIVKLRKETLIAEKLYRSMDGVASEVATFFNSQTN